MTPSPMQAINGRVTSASQKSVVVDVWSQNVGWTTEQNEEITLRLDSVDVPFILRTSKARRIFIAEGDQLDVACIAAADHLAVYGMRNVSDGSAYLVRTASVANARMTLFCLTVAIAVFGLITGLPEIWDPDTMQSSMFFLECSGMALFLGTTAVVSSSVFGYVPFRSIRLLVQPGGRREMRAAKDLLQRKSEKRLEYLML